VSTRAPIPPTRTTNEPMNRVCILKAQEMCKARREQATNCPHPVVDGLSCGLEEEESTTISKFPLLIECWLMVLLCCEKEHATRQDLRPSSRSILKSTVIFQKCVLPRTAKIHSIPQASITNSKYCIIHLIT
jgi:hypothetical protein